MTNDERKRFIADLDKYVYLHQCAETTDEEMQNCQKKIDSISTEEPRLKKPAFQKSLKEQIADIESEYADDIASKKEVGVWMLLMGIGIWVGAYFFIRWIANEGVTFDFIEDVNSFLTFVLAWGFALCLVLGGFGGLYAFFFPSKLMCRRKVKRCKEEYKAYLHQCKAYDDAWAIYNSDIERRNMLIISYDKLSQVAKSLKQGMRECSARLNLKFNKEENENYAGCVALLRDWFVKGIVHEMENDTGGYGKNEGYERLEQYLREESFKRDVKQKLEDGFKAIMDELQAQGNRLSYVASSIQDMRSEINNVTRVAAVMAGSANSLEHRFDSAVNRIESALKNR